MVGELGWHAWLKSPAPARLGDEAVQACAASGMEGYMQESMSWGCGSGFHSLHPWRSGAVLHPSDVNHVIAQRIPWPGAPGLASAVCAPLVPDPACCLCSGKTYQGMDLSRMTHDA